MLSHAFDDIADVVLNRRQVYSLDVDARIREVADRLSARAFFELLSRLDPLFPNMDRDYIVGGGRKRAGGAGDEGGGGEREAWVAEVGVAGGAIGVAVVAGDSRGDGRRGDGGGKAGASARDVDERRWKTAAKRRDELTVRRPRTRGHTTLHYTRC